MLQLITKKTDYGLTFLINLARQNSGKPANLAKIAAENHLPKSFLAKLASLLVRAKIIKSKEGVRGGYTLAKNPNEISLSEVLQALEYKKNDNRTCTSSCGCEFCSQRDVVNPLEAVISKSLQKKTLADLISKRNVERLTT